MARRTYPDAGSQLAYGVSGDYLAHRVGAGVVFYTTSALTTLADVRARNADGSLGSAYAGSSVPVNSASMLPLFFGPDDDSDTLWYDRGGGVAEPVYARTDDRLDALEAAVDGATADALGWRIVTDFGADETGGSDSTAAFAAAFASAGAGGCVYAPPGIYDLTAMPAAVTGQRLVAAGQRAVMINHIGSGLLIDWNANYLGIEHLRLYAGADTTGLLRFRDSSQMHVLRVELDGTDATNNNAVGLWLRDKNNDGTGGCYYGTFDHVYAHACKWGAFLESQPQATPLIAAHLFTNAVLSDNRNDGMLLSYCQGIVFDGGSMERNGKAPTAPEAGRGYGLNLAMARAVRGNPWIEGNKAGTVNVQSSSGNSNIVLEPTALSQYAADGGPSNGIVGAANLGPNSYIQPIYDSTFPDSSVIDTRLSETVQTKTTTYTAKSGETVLANATSGAFTVTLPTSQKGAKVTVKKTDASANAVTVSPASGTIDGAATLVLPTQYVSRTLVCSGTDWHVT